MAGSPKFEYSLPEEVKRSVFATILDEDDRPIIKQMHLRNILKEIETAKSKLYALVEKNISERSEVEIKRSTGFDTYDGAKDLLLLLLKIIHSFTHIHQLAQTVNPLVDGSKSWRSYTTTINSG